MEFSVWSRNLQLAPTPDWRFEPTIYAPPAASLAKRIGQYDLIEPIGKGGMGVVWKGRHRHLDQMVAIKFLTPESWSDSQAVARFYREMRAVGRVVHPNLVRALDAGDHDGHHILVMEFLQGVTIRDLLPKTGPLSVADAAEIARQAALGIAAIAAAGMTHRDIKPSNLFLTNDGVVKVMDLGLARMESDDKDRDLTHSGYLLGTIDYMAPEQSTDPRNVDFRADLYSLGCTLFALLTGKAPFGGREYSTLESRLRAHREATPPELKSIRSDAPAELCNILSKLLAKETLDRPATTEEVIQVLATAANGSNLLRRIQSIPAQIETISPPAEHAKSLSSLAVSAFNVDTSKVPVPASTPTIQELQGVAPSQPIAQQTGLSGRRFAVVAVTVSLCIVIAFLVRIAVREDPLSQSPLAVSPTPDVEKPGEPNPEIKDYTNSPLLQMHELFERRPVPVFWRSGEIEGVRIWNEKQHQFDVSNRDTGLFVLGSVQAKSYNLEIHIDQIGGWTGGVGMFFGLRNWHSGQAEPGWSCWSLMVQHVTNPSMNRINRLDFSKVDCIHGKSGPTEFAISGEGSELLGGLQGEAVLDISIKEGIVSRIAFAGRDLVDLRQSINELQPPVDWNGPFGVIVDHGSCTFRKARLKLVSRE